MESRRRFLNPAQPQTLQIAVFLLYANAVIWFVFWALGRNLGLFLLLCIPGGLAAGYGIANERKWGYGLGIAVAFLPLLPIVLALIFSAEFAVDPLFLMFQVALVALLLHPQSRDYQRIWFK